MPTFDALHPAPVRYLPRRGRVERTAYERIATPVTLHETSAAEMRPIGTLTQAFNGRSQVLFDHAGETWTHLMGPSAARPVLAESLLSFLKDNSTLIGEWGMPYPLMGTPLHRWKPTSERDPSRGDPPDPTGIGRIIEDGRDRARTEVASYVARDLRLCEGVAFIRFRGPLAYRRSDENGRVTNTYQVAAIPHHYCSTSGNLDAVVGLDAIGAHATFLRGLGNPLGLDDPSGAAGIIGLEPGDLALPVTDDDLALAANHGLTQVLRRTRAVIEATGERVEDLPGLRAALAGLDGHGMRAIVHGVRPEEYGEVLQGMDALLRALLARVPGDAKGLDHPRRQAGWLTHHLLPRAASATIEADAADLQGLTR